MRTCFICGSQGRPHTHFKFWQDYQFNVNWCASCGVGWVVDLPQSSVFSDAYERLNFLSWKDKTPEQLSKDVMRAYLKGIRVAKTFRELKGKNLKTSELKVLEVGSNIGAVLRGVMNTLELKSDQLIGVDFSRNHAEVCESKFGIHTLIETLDSAAPKIEKQFDLIICHHIIEHDENPINFLAILKKLLKPEGIVSFELPNGYREVQCFRSDLEAGITPSTLINHINYFSPRGFRNFLKRNQMKVRHLCTLNSNRFFYDMGWLGKRKSDSTEVPKIEAVPNRSVKYVFEDQAIMNGVQKAQLPGRFIGLTHKLRIHYPDSLPLGRDIEAYVQIE